MARRGKVLGQDERRARFAQKLNRLLLERGWSGADLAREMTKHAPAEVGRHLVSAYTRGANEPTEANLKYMSKALGVKPEDLVPPLLGEGENAQYATATSTLDGKTRLIVDAEVDAETALQVLQLIRTSTKKKTGVA